jgi:hypothetical protein
MASNRLQQMRGSAACIGTRLGLGALVLAAGLVFHVADARAQVAEVLPGSSRTCKATLEDGTPYEIGQRILLKKWEGKAIYVLVRAYYHPTGGETLWRSTDYYVRPNEKTSGKGLADRHCREPFRHLLRFNGGEWADFVANNGRVVAWHSALKFPDWKAAWAYIGEHWRDGDDGPGADSALVREILLYDELGRDFFRPKSLEFGARPYSYDSLASVTKTDAGWELQIKRAHEPTWARVILNKDFQLVSAKRVP